MVVGGGRNEARRAVQAVKSGLPAGPTGQTCIPAAAVQPELTPIRPPPASLPDRFLLCRHATPTNYGGLTRNRLDCDLKLRFIFLVGFSVCVCVCVKGKGRAVRGAAGLWDVWADEGRCTGSISITGSPLSNASRLPQYTNVSDLEAVVSNTLLLSQHPSALHTSVRSLFIFPRCP